MDWDRARQRNRQGLMHLLESLCAMLGIRPGQSLETVPQPLYWAVLALLRPAESALRRLIVVEARGLAPVAPLPLRDRPLSRTDRVKAGGRSGPRPPQFRLFDPRKRFEPPKSRRPLHPPRITVLGLDDWTPYPVRLKPEPGVPKPASSLCRRIEAMHRALADPPAQARRLMRWMARRAALRAARRPVKFIAPLRPGAPPGHRMRGGREVDRILAELSILARWAEHPPPPPIPA